jgi:hypothetical protein
MKKGGMLARLLASTYKHSEKGESLEQRALYLNELLG